MSNTRPCRCWTEPITQHDGHCCFTPDTPKDCHDEECAALERRSGNGLGGPLMERRYWLTDKGWDAIGGRTA